MGHSRKCDLSCKDCLMLVPPESREIPGRNFLFKAQGSNMCSAYTLNHVLGYDIPPTILTTDLQVGLLDLFHRAENRHREVGIGLSLSKGADCGFELKSLWFLSLCSFHYTLNSSPRGLLIIQESTFGFFYSLSEAAIIKSGPSLCSSSIGYTDL